jgi:hypothetical protein
LAELDLDRLVAELQARVDERSHRLWSALVPLLTGLLVWAYRPEGQAARRAEPINDRRAALRALLWASPGLSLEGPEAVAWAYPRARRAAAPDTGLAFTDLPQVCPWALDDLLADGWPAVVAQPTPHDDRDFGAWAQQQAAVLRARDVSGLDWDHLAEGVETLHRDERTQITGHLRVLCLHLWRWAVEPDTREAWRSAITSARLYLDDFGAMSPSLEAEWLALLAAALQDARRHGAQDTGLPVETFPVVCPWSLGQLRDHGCWPGALDVS